MIQMSREERVARCLACNEKKAGNAGSEPMTKLLICDKNTHKRLTEVRKLADEADVMVESAKKISDPRERVTLLEKAAEAYDRYYHEIRDVRPSLKLEDCAYYEKMKKQHPELKTFSLCDVTEAECEAAFAYRKDALFKRAEILRVIIEEAMAFDPQLALKLGMSTILALHGVAKTAYHGADLAIGTTDDPPGKADYQTAIKTYREAIELCNKLAEIAATPERYDGERLERFTYHIKQDQERLLEIQTEARLLAYISQGQGDVEDAREKFSLMRYPPLKGPNF